MAWTVNIAGAHGDPLPHSFYERPARVVARALLGKVLVHEGRAGRIVETEAYVGAHDLACHAARGKTARTQILWGPAGRAYVYFIYGMHWCFNAVTRSKGEPSAVLVRAIEPMTGMHLMRTRRGVPRDVDLTNGPAKLCEALSIDGTFNRAALQRGPLTIREGSPVADSNVVVTPRIGISRCADWPLRWVVSDSSYLSRKPTGASRVL